MSHIARGFTFDSTPLLVSYTALHGLVDNALVTSIPMSEFATTAHVSQTSATDPAGDQGAGSLWFDTTLNILRVLNSTRQDCPYVGPEMLNSSGGTIKAGTLVVATADNVIGPCVTAAWPETLGFVVADVLNGEKGVVRKTGIGQIAIAGPVTIGDTLIGAGTYTSWSNGRVRSAKAAGSTLVTLGVECAISLVQVGATTALATCLVMR